MAQDIFSTDPARSDRLSSIVQRRMSALTPAVPEDVPPQDAPTPFEANMPPRRGALQDITQRRAQARIPQVPPVEDQGTSFGDYTRSFARGLDQIGRLIGKRMQAVGLERAGGAVSNLYRERAAQQEAGMTPAYRAEQAKPMVQEVPEGQGLFGSSYRPGPGLTSIPKIAGQALESVPGTAAGMALGGLGGAALRYAGASPAVAGALGYGAGEAAVAAGSTAAEIHDTIMAMPDDVLTKSPEFRDLYAAQPEGTTHENRMAAARSTLAASAARSGAIPDAISTFLLSAPAGAVFGKFLGGEIVPKTALGRIGLGMAAEGGQEFAQSGPEQYWQNLALRRANPDQPLYKDVLEQAVAGGIGGALLGAGSAAIAGPHVQEQTAPTTEPVAPTVMDQADPRVRQLQDIVQRRMAERQQAPLARPLGDEAAAFSPQAMGLAQAEGMAPLTTREMDTRRAQAEQESRDSLRQGALADVERTLAERRAARLAEEFGIQPTQQAGAPLEYNIPEQAQEMARQRYLEQQGAAPVVQAPEGLPSPVSLPGQPVENLPVASPAIPMPSGPIPISEDRLNKMPATSLRRVARGLGMGEEVAGMKKAELVPAILAAQEVQNDREAQGRMARPVGEQGQQGQPQEPGGAVLPGASQEASQRGGIFQTPGQEVAPAFPEDQTGITFRPDGRPWERESMARRAGNRLMRQTGQAYEPVHVGDGWGLQTVSQSKSQANINLAQSKPQTVHTMPDGTTMAGPEHPGAVPGSERVISPQAPVSTPAKASRTGESANVEQGARQPLPSLKYAEAKRQVGGGFKLFYRGTSNEVFPGMVFDSAPQSGRYLREQLAAEERGLTSPVARTTLPTGATDEQARAAQAAQDDAGAAATSAVQGQAGGGPLESEVQAARQDILAGAINDFANDGTLDFERFALLTERAIDQGRMTLEHALDLYEEIKGRLSGYDDFSITDAEEAFGPVERSRWLADQLREMEQQRTNAADYQAAANQLRDTAIDRYTSIIGRIRKAGGLNSDWVRTFHGPGVVEDLQSKLGWDFLSREGVKPDEIAGELGFTDSQGLADGQALVEYLQDAPNKKQIEAQYRANREGRASRVPDFYSPAAKFVAGINTEKPQPAKFWLDQMFDKKGQPKQGLRPEELEDLGLREWLDGLDRPVSKAEVQAFIEAGGPKLEEVRKGLGLTQAEDMELREIKARMATNSASDADYDRLGELQGKQFATESVPTKFQDYQLPGGENYREVLVTLPVEPLRIVEVQTKWGPKWEVRTPDGQVLGGQFSAKMGAEAFINQNLEQQRRERKDSFTSSHWSEPNVLAHFRLNDRTDAAGRRTLFIEEIQSDWHQAGRKKGYKTATPMTEGWTAKRFDPNEEPDMLGRLTWEVADAEGNVVGNLAATSQEKALEQIRTRTPDSRVPNAPFKKSWAMLAFKKVLKMAVDEGYDAVAWTPGEVQAERYDLSKQVSRLSWNAASGELLAVMPDGVRVERIAEGVTADKLESYVGKDPAAKLQAAEENDRGFRVIEGEDLKVGGEGMKSFYDKMLPNEVQKYVKKLDPAAKVGTDKIDLKTPGQLAGARMNAEAAIGTPLEGMYSDQPKAEVWSLPITDAMREAVQTQGQPLYSRSTTPTTGLPVSEVKAAIEPFLRMAGDNAAPTVAVQSVADMPTAVQNAYNAQATKGEGRIRAFFHSGTTYLIADQIADKSDALAGWKHEEAGHYGTRALFPVERQFRNVMDATYQGMPRTERKRIAELYGVDRNDLNSRLLIADEYIASLAEKVNLDEALAPREQTLWQRFVAAVRRAWRSVFGRRGEVATLTDKQVAAIVKDAARIAMTGKDSGEARAIYRETFREPVLSAGAGMEDEGRASRVPLGPLSPTRAYARNEQGQFSTEDTRGPVTFTREQSEARFQEAKKGLADQRSILRRVTDEGRHLLRQFRYLPELPKTEQFAEAREAIRQFEASPTVAKEMAIRALDDITGQLKPADYDLFTRKVILDDLAHEAGKDHALPFGFTPETVAQDKARVDARVNDSPAVQEALTKRGQVLEGIKRGLLDSGVMTEEQFNNPNYFRHQVITYAAERLNAQGAGRLRKPRPGYAMKREGSIEDINANYLEAEFEYLHRALIDTKAARTIERLAAKYDKRAEAQAQAEKWNAAHPNEAKRSWKDFIPEGYASWSPEKGNVFYTGRPEAERIMSEFMDRVKAEGGIPGVSQEEIAEVMRRIGEAEAKRGRMFNLVIPEELATTLSGMASKNTRGWLDQAFRTPLSYWKLWVLINPRRVLKYNLNNLSGDLDAVIAGNPSALKMLPQAIRELYAVMKGAEPSARYREALERGVFDTGLTVQEIPEINKLDRFTRLRGDLTAKDMPMEVARRAWRTLKDYTQFRENWLRYAAYLDYVERLEGGESMDKVGYGASYKPLVDGLTDAKDKAGLLARDLVGDYGSISEAGKEIRAKLIPFFSFMEVNTRRYLRIFKNAYDQGIGQGLKTTGTVGAIKGAKLSAWLAVRTAMLYGLVQMWNRLFFPDEEKELDSQARMQLHLTLGRDRDGKVISLRMQGALSDFLSWVGFEDAVGVVTEMQKGRASWRELMETVGKAPLNKIAGGITPLIKTPVEMAAKRSFFPDMFKPKVISDRTREFSRLFSMENEYDWLTGAPTRGYWSSVRNAITYERDTGETAYNNIQERKRDYMSKVLGREGTGDYSSPRGEALRMLRKALKYGDKDAEKRAREKLRGLGVKPQDIHRSILTQRPLYGLNAQDRTNFKRTLTADEVKQLDQAEKWYRDVYLGTGGSGR